MCQSHKIIHSRKKEKSCGCGNPGLIATLPEMSKFILTFKNDYEIEKFGFNNNGATGSHCDKSTLSL